VPSINTSGWTTVTLNTQFTAYTQMPTERRDRYHCNWCGETVPFEDGFIKGTNEASWERTQKAILDPEHMALPIYSTTAKLDSDLYCLTCGNSLHVAPFAVFAWKVVNRSFDGRFVTPYKVKMTLEDLDNYDYYCDRLSELREELI